MLLEFVGNDEIPNNFDEFVEMVPIKEHKVKVQKPPSVGAE